MQRLPPLRAAPVVLALLDVAPAPARAAWNRAGRPGGENGARRAAGMAEALARAARGPARDAGAAVVEVACPDGNHARRWGDTLAG